MSNDERDPDWPGTGYPVPYDDAPGLPDRIIYRELDVGHGMARYSRIDMPRSYSSRNRFRQILKKIAKGEYREKRKDKKEINDLDIPLYGNAYVVVKLVGGAGFGAPGVDLVSRSNRIGGLRFVTNEGEIEDKFFEGCEIVFFRVQFSEGTDNRPEKISINYYDPSRARIAPIDPDIRHPGVGGNGIDPDP